MNSYDEKIKVKQSQIAKLQKDIDNKKSKISKLQSEIKQLETAKNEEFSRDFIKKMLELGLNSPDDRQAVLNKIEDFALEREIEKSEKKAKSSDMTNNEKTEKQDIYENQPTVKNT